MSTGQNIRPFDSKSLRFTERVPVGRSFAVSVLDWGLGDAVCVRTDVRGHSSTKHGFRDVVTPPKTPVEGDRCRVVRGRPVDGVPDRHFGVVALCAS